MQCSVIACIPSTEDKCSLLFRSGLSSLDPIAVHRAVPCSGGPTRFTSKKRLHPKNALSPTPLDRCRSSAEYTIQFDVRKDECVTVFVKLYYCILSCHPLLLFNSWYLARNFVHRLWIIISTLLQRASSTTFSFFDFIGISAGIHNGKPLCFSSEIDVETWICATTRWILGEKQIAHGPSAPCFLQFEIYFQYSQIFSRIGKCKS